MASTTDLFVIGGGSGGVRAARVAAGDRVQRSRLAEESRYGGTCVIRGCVPKKLMVFASEYRDMAEDARAYGWDITDGPFDWPRSRRSCTPNWTGWKASIATCWPIRVSKHSTAARG